MPAGFDPAVEASCASAACPACAVPRSGAPVSYNERPAHARESGRSRLMRHRDDEGDEESVEHVTFRLHVALPLDDLLWRLRRDIGTRMTAQMKGESCLANRWK